MKPSLALLGLLGGGVYLLTKKPTPTTKKSTETKPTDKDTKPSDTDLPNVDDEEEKDLPGVDDKDPPLDDDEDKDPEASDEEIKEDTIKLMNEYYNPYLLTGISGPNNVNEKKIWISNDCMNWGVRKGYDLSLPEKYLYPNPTNPDKLTTPWQYWEKIGADLSPAPIYLADLPSDSPHAAIAANIVDYFTPCDISPPRRKQFKTYGEYKIVRNKFAETPLGKLFEYLSSTIKNVMLAPWEKKYPEKAKMETLKAWAMWAIKNNPNLNDFGKLTDIAYTGLVSQIPEAPKKIDPKNPAHKPYLDMWMRINIEVKNYKGLIKQYGLD